MLIMPSRSSFDLFESKEKRNNVKLAFTMDDCDKLMPDLLNMIKGVVSPEDLHFNLWNENLQANKIWRMIKNTSSRHAAKSSPRSRRRRTITNRRGGGHVDLTNRTKIAERSRWSESKFGDEQIGFTEYIDRTRKGHNDIYFNTGESIVCRVVVAVLGDHQHEGIGGDVSS
mmetsp:Transcript_78951/g.200953  ORF Transcript_78951/g.200953 Transcript_78951/m.200953 type:complete len:171 (+) Transcript_78951:403-915(+)